MVHVLSVLPPLSEKNTKLVINLFYEFIWNKKQDKIKRLRLCCDYSDGGLKLTHLPSFTEAIHVSWIYRLFSNQQADSSWKILFHAWSGINCDVLKRFSEKQVVEFANKRFKANPFWYHALLSWSKTIQYSNCTNYGKQCIWFNPEILINNSSIFYMDWYQKGIVYFADLLDANGNLLSFTNFCEKYQIRQSSYLKYYGLASAIPHHWKFRQNNSHNDDYVLVSRKQVYVKILGKVLNANLKPQACLYKWQRLFGEGLDFVYYFKLPFIITQDSKLRNFQYRLLNRITTTNKFLKLRNVVDTDKCTFCMIYVETLVHLFYECNHVALPFFGVMWRAPSMINVILL